MLWGCLVGVRTSATRGMFGEERDAVTVGATSHSFKNPLVSGLSFLV